MRANKRGRLSRLLWAASLVAFLALTHPPAPADADPAAFPAFYFHGTDADQANKSQVFVDPAARGTATWDQNPPTRVAPIVQDSTSLANQDFVGNPLAAYWRAPFSGTIQGVLALTVFLSSPASDPPGFSVGTMTVTVFADPQYVSNRVQTDRIAARTTVRVVSLFPTPKKFVVSVPITSPRPAAELMIQITSSLAHNLAVSYDSVSTPSGFRLLPSDPAPQVSFSPDSVAFAPSTIVSPVHTGAEPQVTLERRLPSSLPGRIDDNRIFVDWPYSTQTQADLFHRSTDGGDSFRLLVDPLCPQRNRPNCKTLGAGDSENEVNLVNGNVFFSDQEAVVTQESILSSTDHGDTFPATRQFAITNATTGTDRQWVGWIDPGLASVGGRRLEAFLAWHLPIVGQYVVGIDQDGVPVPQPVTQIFNVGQSGPIRVDNTDGPGRGWIYQIFIGFGMTISTATAPEYQQPIAWHSTILPSATLAPPDADDPAIFPWLNLDDRGNAYAVWVPSSGARAGRDVFLTVAPIDDPRNNPALGGVPGSFWTRPVKVNPPSVTSVVFPQVTAGSPGRVAVAYMGSTDCAGPSDACPDAAHWDVYAAILTDALGLAQGRTAAIAGGQVNRRVVHRGKVCTSGAGCGDTDDRSLLDMFDLGVDAAGRVGVVFMNNNDAMNAPDRTQVAKGSPFVHFAKIVRGPSLLAGQPDPDISIPENSRPDAALDATWPNTQQGANRRAFDLLGASVFVSGDDLIAQIPVADSTRGGMLGDLAAYNGISPLDTEATRIQYVLRFETAEDVWHLSMDMNSDGTRRFHGGRVDANDVLAGPTGLTGAAGSRDVADAGIPAAGSAGQGVITLRAPKTAFGVDVGSRLLSVSAFALAAPPESENRLTFSARVVDATPPFDATLPEGPEPKAPVDCDDPEIASYGGWHTLSDARAGEGTLCRNVGARKASSGAFLEFQFDGTALDITVAKGPRGGSFSVAIDGGAATRVDLYRAPADPARPDNSGRKDLDFGVTLGFPAGTGRHTARIEVLNDDPDPKRDMIYIDGFAVAGGAIVPRAPGTTTDLVTTLTGTIAGGATQILNVAIGAAAQHFAAVVEAADGVQVVVRDATAVLQTAAAVGGVAAAHLPPVAAGTVAVEIRNETEAEVVFEAWEVVTEQR